MKQTNKGIYIILYVIISLLLIGCSKPIECENITINNTIEVIKYINRNVTITEKCNITNNTIRYTYTGTTSREIELIRRIGFLEGQQDKYWNYSECNWELNNTKNELRDCEDSMCYVNSSWC